MTKIPWTDKTWNMIGGCSPVSPGCAGCAAAKAAQRCVNLGNDKYKGLVKDGKWTGEIRLFDSVLEEPLHMKKPCMIFVEFMGDLFHKSVPFEFIDKVWRVMEECSQHTFQILTKQPERMYDFLGGESGAGLSAPPLPNIWLGVSAENQEWWDKRKEALFATPAALHYVSFEPLLGEIILTDEDLRRLGWAIIGAESKGAWPGRECKNKWIYSIVVQCIGAKVPVFVKQFVKDNRLVKDSEAIKTYYPQQYPNDKGE